VARSEHVREQSVERGKAGDRLNAALGEQDRLVKRYDAAVGTSQEMSAYAHLRDAGEQVAARDAWVKWLDRDY
jgi:hypothetical protein